MHFHHRPWILSCSTLRTCLIRERACKVSAFPHLSRGTHMTTTTATQVDDHIAALSRSICTLCSPHICFPLPSSKRRVHCCKSTARFYATAMPKDRKGKSKGGASKEVDISKSLSYLLRHGAKDEGITLDEGGWANVADVVGFGFFLFLVACCIHDVLRSSFCLTYAAVLVLVRRYWLESCFLL